MSSPAPRRVLARAIATLVAVAVFIACVVLVIVTVASKPATPAAALADDRSQALNSANTFVEGILTVDPSMLKDGKIPAFRQKVESVLTSAYTVWFEQEWAGPLEKAMGAAPFKTSVQIASAGVVAISDDKATILLVGSRRLYSPKSAGSKELVPQTEDPIRVILSLEKVQGKWLVSNQALAEGLNGLASSAPASSTPSASATGSSK